MQNAISLDNIVCNCKKKIPESFLIRADLSRYKEIAGAMKPVAAPAIPAEKFCDKCNKGVGINLSCGHFMCSACIRE